MASLPHPWKDASYFIHKYISCERNIYNAISLPFDAIVSPPTWPTSQHALLFVGMFKAHVKLCLPLQVF